MVITGRTRNALAFTGTWVRIPPAPPKTKATEKCNIMLISVAFNFIIYLSIEEILKSDCVFQIILKMFSVVVLRITLLPWRIPGIFSKR